MLDVPDDILDKLVRKRITLIAEVPAHEPENRAWVYFEAFEATRAREKWERPGQLAFLIWRMELPRSIAEDEMGTADEYSYLTHEERTSTQDIEEAFAKAAEYEPDWSKWGTHEDHPHSPLV